VLLTRALLPLDLPPMAEGLLLIALTFSICLAAYALLRHVPVLREWVGIAPPRQATAPAPFTSRSRYPSPSA